MGKYEVVTDIKTRVEDVSNLIQHTDFENLKNIVEDVNLNDNEKLKKITDVWFKADVCTNAKCSKCNNFKLCFTIQGIYSKEA